jgi:hypothetical protein
MLASCCLDVPFKIPAQLLDRLELIRHLAPADMPVVALSGLIVVADKTDAVTTVIQSIL